MLDIYSSMRNKQQYFGEFLKAQRESNGLSLRAVEDKTGISNAYLSQMESGKIKQPSPTLLHKLANFYEVSYEVLMQMAGYPIPETQMHLERSPEVYGRLGILTPSEEEAVLDYLAFLRSKSRSKGKKR